jgi:hypothetical protein
MRCIFTAGAAVAVALALLGSMALGAQDGGTTEARLELPFDSAVAPATLPRMREDQSD